MKLIRLLWTDSKRAVLSWKFIITVLLMIMVSLLSSGMTLFLQDYSAIEMIDLVFNGTGSAYLILMLFPLIPFALTYAMDVQDRAVGFWVIRVGAERFLFSKFLISCLSAFLSIFVAFWLLTGILVTMGHPLIQGLSTYEGMNYGYYQYLEKGNYILYLLPYLMDRGMSGAMMAACAVCISCIYPNIFVTFSAPICIYLLALRLLNFPTAPMYLQVSNWIEGRYDAPEGVFVTLLCKLGVTILVCTVYGVLTILIGRRRWQHA